MFDLWPKGDVCLEGAELVEEREVKTEMIKIDFLKRRFDKTVVKELVALGVYLL